MAFKRVRRARLQADWREIFKPGWGLWGKWGGVSDGRRSSGREVVTRSVGFS